MHQGAPGISQAEDRNTGVLGWSFTVQGFLAMEVVDKGTVNGKSNDPCVGLKPLRGAQGSF